MGGRVGCIFLAMVAALAGCQQDRRPTPGQTEPPAPPPAVKPAPQPSAPPKTDAPPAAQPAPKPSPAVQPAPSNAMPSVAEPPPPPAPPVEPAAADKPQEPAENELPPYVKILRPGGRADLAHVDITLKQPATLQLATRDVERLWVGRRELPVGRNRNVILRVDGQVFEWSRRHDALELHFTRSGGWQIARAWPED
jgi:hypothetical protein